ncbi:MAG: efflux RND transporter permease subunit [Candidatus Thiodiazotropha sp.]|nr:efflux RND transporter permease subunit [Candidatus Thiodiazotropha taylori]MBT3060424.1 efflux RND transporter permease subunit [Candidatus Thiodiazotropha sp. (ex Lucina pensylvanica)]MBT3064391.1 efflux RND transporter permease subunit [Candidatus Thiodiazotropha sp. (ex Lucina pensylvanica)]MBV2093325.1 efflux RND transporter permease subunit [Candidatus Thiodiazotropha sp. (ex Codakia orbicularis)]PUB72844.1 MAG: AcrB/AcrD/AcrF family protein [gamma proteobacterium symbiont of Ctena orb
MHEVVAFSLKQRVFYNLMFVVLIVIGFYTLFALPAERYPNFGFGEVIISTVYPGASPVEVETLVTRKIEDAIEQVDDVEWISSTSFSGRSNIRLKFVDDSDYDALYNEVRFEVLNIISELPEGVDPPSLLNAKVQDWLPVIAINLVGDHSNRALALMGEEIKTRLLRIPHVQQVDFSGKQTQEFHVYLDPQKLREFGIGFDQVARALSAANLTIPAGKYTNRSGEYLVKLDERFHSLEQVHSTVVRRDADGSLVRVMDLITHTGMGYRDSIVISSVNGKPALGLKVVKSDQGNAMEIRDQVVAVIDEFRPVLKAQGVDVVLTQDSTVYIKDGLTTLGMNMLVGIFLVSLIIWYFMGIRNAGLVTIGIPFSFMITMLIMYLTGNSLNEITLFSFVLVTGIVVDDAIVVTENIYRHVQEGKPLRDAIINGTAEVALPVISATMTTVAAFLPMLIMSGSTGQFFALVPKAVSFAIIASLIECLLILPIHYLDFGPRQQGALELQQRDNAMMRVARRFTDWLLSLTMRYRLTSLMVVTLLFGVAVMILALSASGKVPLIRIQFFPDDYKLYYVDIVGPSNIALEEVDERVKRIAESVMEDGPGMASAAAGLAGLYFNEDYEPIYGNNHGSVMVTMPSASDQTFDDPLAHLDRMRERLKPIYETDGYRLHIHPQNDGPPSGKDINVRVVGANVDAVSGLARELLQFMRESPEIGPHLIGLNDDRGVPKRVFRLQVEQERVAEYGLDNGQVAQLAASVLDGRYLGKYRHIDEEVDLKLRIDPQALRDPENALYIPVVEDAERPIYLADLVSVQTYNESGEIKRYQGQRAISLKADIRDGAPTSTPAVVNRVKSHFETIRERYPGATVTFGGEHEDTQRSFESLAYAFIIAVLVMYVILATQFQSYLQPLIILSAIVFALIGVVFGKLVTQSLFTVNSFIAVIGVAGVVVNDALVLIDFINKRYRKGLSRREAIIEGVNIRLRPILLTTLTTSLGLLPMAIGFPSYSLIWGTMASTFVTGLATATALTLFIIPVLWDLVQGLQEWIHRRRAGRAGEEWR